MKKLIFLTLTILQITSQAAPQYHHPQAFLDSIKNDKHAGEKIYQHYCVSCHAKEPMIPLGAPRVGVNSDWEGRLSRDLNAMLKRIDAGFGTMPPRGGCFECSDKQLKAAIAYMLPKSKS